MSFAFPFIDPLPTPPIFFFLNENKASSSFEDTNYGKKNKISKGT